MSAERIQAKSAPERLAGCLLFAGSTQGRKFSSSYLCMCVSRERNDLNIMDCVLLQDPVYLESGSPDIGPSVDHSDQWFSTWGTCPTAGQLDV